MNSDIRRGLGADKTGNTTLDYLLIVCFGVMMLMAVFVWAGRQQNHDCLTLQAIGHPTAYQQQQMADACK